MRQKAYKKVAELITAGTKLKAGATTHATALGLTVGTEVLINVDLNGLLTTTATHLAGKGTLRDRRVELKQATDAAYVTVKSIRDTLTRKLGRTYSPAWDGSGFNYSLRISKSVSGLESQLRALQGYLADHPTLEVADVATADLAGEAVEALTVANTAVTLQKAVVRGQLNARKLKEKAMRLRISGVVEELNRVIGGLDVRWEAFGLNQPDLKQAPPQPQNVVVTLVGNNGLVKWDKTARAEYYRVWVKAVGVDNEAQPVGSPADTDFTIENPAPNTQYEVAISALNNGGESPRSAVVVFQTA